MTKDVCIPCRFSHPTRPPLKAVYRIPTNKPRAIPACHVHHGNICSHCLRVQSSDFRTEPNLLLRRPVNGDVDELGIPRNQDGLTCALCREVAFTATIRRDLEGCSRGREVRGFDNAWAHTIAFKEHVYFGVGRSDMMARQAIEDWFLLQHTSYYQLLNDIGTVQALLRKYKIQVYETRAMRPPAPELAQISRVIWSMFDEEDQNAFDLPRLYRRWCHEIDNKVYDEYDYRLDIDRIRHNLSAASLWPWVRDRVAQRALDLWAQDRFINGFWVMPSDEIEQMLDPSRQIHTPLYEIAQNVSRTSEYGRPPAVDPWRSSGGRFRYDVNPLEQRPREQRNAELFLPPDRLLQTMDMRFSEVVGLRMDAALAEIMRSYIRLPYEEYDRIEAHLAAFKVPQLIALLEEPYAWFEVDDASGSWPLTLFPIPPASDATVMSSISEEDEPEEQSFSQLDAQDDRDGNNDGDDLNDEPSKRNEPHIEVITINDDHPLYYGIVEGWSTTSDERDEFGVPGEHEDRTSERCGMESTADSGAPSPKIGKRKATDDEAPSDHLARGPRSRLGSGQTSHSGSGESTNTALVTPDESPSLLAEERIQVAEEDNTATDTTPVATLAISTTSPVASPTLGKRKSPDDDDLIRPPRRPASIPTPPRGTSDGDMGEADVKPDCLSHASDPLETKAAPHPTDKTEEDEAKPVSVSNEDVGVGQPMADAAIDADVGDSEAKRSTASEKQSSAPSTTTEEGLTQPPSPAQTHLLDGGHARAVAVPKEGWSRAGSIYSELSDSLSEASIDSEKLAEVPSVPAMWSHLGPGVEELLESTWYRAREKLRLCRCAVCIRAMKHAAEAERRKFLEDDDDIIFTGILRIA